MSDWVAVLKKEVACTSQARAAKRIGYSPTVINQVLKGTYKGNLIRVEEKVRGELMGKTVQCPVLGETLISKCLEHQKRKFASTNPQRVQLWHACRRGCKYSKLGEK